MDVIEKALSFAIGNGLLSESDRARCSEILSRPDNAAGKIEHLRSFKFQSDIDLLNRLQAPSAIDPTVNELTPEVNIILEKELNAARTFRTDTQSTVQELR